MSDLNRIIKLLPEKQHPERVHRMWQEVMAKYGRKRVPRPSRLFALSLASAAAACAAILFLMMPTPVKKAGPLVLQQGGPIPRVIETEEVSVERFSDGSSARLESGTKLRLVESSEAHVRFELKKGRTRFDIVPGGPRTWQVDLGRVLVTVLGTAFVAERDDAHISVRVERGVVRVSGEGVENGEQRLVAGNSIRIENAREEETASAPSAAPMQTPPPADESPALEKAEEGKDDRPSSKTHASKGRYQEAFEQLGTDGFAALALRSKSVDELFALADVARQSAHSKDAVLPLEIIVDKFRDDPKAGLAAYTLGRLYLEQLSSPKKALVALDEAELLGLPEALEEAHMVKRIQALRLMNDPRGDTLTKQYLLHYPDGRYMEQVQRSAKED